MIRANIYIAIPFSEKLHADPILNTVINEHVSEFSRFVRSVDRNPRELNIYDYTGYKLGNPQVLAKAISKDSKSPNIVYIAGTVQLIEGRPYLNLPNSKPNRPKSLLDIENIASIISNQKGSLLILDTFSPLVIDLYNLSKLKNYFNIIVFDRSQRKYIDYNESALHDFLMINKLAPYYKIKEFVQFLNRTKENILIKVKFNDGKNTRISSLFRDHKVWQLSPHNFSSSNRGSREDGVQELTYAINDATTAYDAKFLLNYISETDKSREVRSAALSTLHEGKIDRHEFRTTFFTDYHYETPEMLLINGGYFLMGSSPDIDSFSLKEEQPPHKIFLDNFKISKTPITVWQWRIFKQSTQPNFTVAKTLDDQRTPITNVNWYEAMEFTIWLTQNARATGEISINDEFRLPTEAEWEKAARGKDARLFPWGESPPAGRCNFRDEQKYGVVPAGSYSPEGDSPYGVQDMAGNVWEWTISLWGRGGSTPEFSYPYNKLDGRENILAPNEYRRVVRGGSFYYFDYCLRCSTRNLMYPATRHSGGGFRVVLTQNTITSRVL